MLKPLLPVTLAVSLVAAAAGCGPLLTLEASSSRYDKPTGKNDVTEKLFEDDEFLADLAKRYGLMALFAEVVYRGELNERDRDRDGCRYLDPGWQGNRQFGMPRLPGAENGWERWIPKTQGEQPCMNDANGLFYETYVYRDAGVIREAVIAFRGTENRAGQAASDWSSNIAAALGVEPAQYEMARNHLPHLIARLTDPVEGNPQVKIYAVGHSLGGGLAQQAGYLSEKIVEVFTFNTTPVTNWTYLRRNGLVKQGFPIIHRLYHGGEALELPRFVATSTTQARYGRHDVGVQFGKRRFASGHSMKILACNFARILSKKKENAGSHYYPVTYIDTHVLKSEDAQVAGAANSPQRICDDDRPGKGHDGQVDKT